MLYCPECNKIYFDYIIVTYWIHENITSLVKCYLISTSEEENFLQKRTLIDKVILASIGDYDSSRPQSYYCCTESYAKNICHQPCQVFATRNDVKNFITSPYFDNEYYAGIYEELFEFSKRGIIDLSRRTTEELVTIHNLTNSLQRVRVT